MKKHPLPKIDKIPWDMGPKFEQRSSYVKSKESTPNPKRVTCFEAPPVEIHQVLMEAQAAEINIPDKVMDWWNKELNLESME